METIRVSPSLLADVVSCKTKAWVRHVKGFTSKGEAIKAVAGKAFHAGIAAYLNPPIGDASKRALREFHRIYDPAFARLDAALLQPQLTPANLHAILDRWLEMQEILPWKRVLSVEEAFVSRIWIIGNTRVELIVRPDIVVEAHDKSVRFVDTKTTGWNISDKGWKKQLRLSSQVALYVDAVRQRYGARAALGGWINAIELNRLPSDPSRRCGDHKKPYVECGKEHAKMEFIECMLTEEHVMAARAEASKAAEWFVAMHAVADAGLLPMDGTFNESCRFCANASWCEANRPTAALEGFLEYDPWVIEEGIRAHREEN